MATDTPDIVRVKEDQHPVSVFVYALQSSVVLSAGKAFNADHPVVLQAPWAFYDDVEEATAVPGKRRTTARRKPATKDADAEG
jgi:hypothetical protein